VLLCAFVALAAQRASARDVAGSSVELAWSPASGRVVAYALFVSRDGGPFRSEQYVAEPRARVAGRVGETIQVRVRAYGIASERSVASAPSEPSEAVRFVANGGAAPAVAAAPPTLAPSEAASPSSTPYGPSFTIEAGGDFDGDGDLDLVATLDSWRHPLVLFLEAGSLAQLAVLAPLEGAREAFAADFDGDGRDELGVQTRESVALLRLERTGSAVPIRREPVPPGARVLPADLDGDGRASLVVYEPNSGLLRESPAPGKTAVDFGAILPLHGLASGDFDGDGRDDLWIQAHPGGDSELWLMREGGSFAVVPLRLDGRLAATATLDWNGDGRDDIAGYDSARGELRAWLLDGGRVLARPGFGPGPVASLHALDLDDDGREDLLVSAPGRAPNALLSQP
jgi:hypothetical protein